MKRSDRICLLDDPTHVGTYIKRRGARVLVRWHPRCATWERRSDLRPVSTVETGRSPAVPDDYTQTRGNNEHRAEITAAL